MERLAWRGFRYLLAICIGVAVILAWQYYGEAAEQIIATRALERGWSPEARRSIASWIERLGWTKPLSVESKAASVTQIAPEPVVAKATATPATDPQQMQQIEADIAAVGQAFEGHLADVRETVEELAASQDQMARTITGLQAADEEVLAKIPTPPPQPPGAPAHKPTSLHPARKLAPSPFWARKPPHTVAR